MKRLILLLMLFAAVGLSAQTYTHYWVDIDAADTTGDGSAYTPFKYLNQVRYVIDSYTIIHVRNGTYNLDTYDDTYSLSSYSNYLGITSSMTNIKLIAEGLDVYIYSDRGETTSPLFMYANNVVIKGIKFDAVGSYGTGILQTVTGGTNKFINCSFGTFGVSYIIRHSSNSSYTPEVIFYNCHFNQFTNGVVLTTLATSDNFVIKFDQCTIGGSVAQIFRDERICDSLFITNSIVNAAKIEKDSDAMDGYNYFDGNTYQVSDSANYSWTNSYDADAGITWNTTNKIFDISSTSVARGAGSLGVGIGTLTPAIEGEIQK